ncbi:LYR motif-containing protein 4 [Adelges cooleyi]|uniref:LYR motif-containing protein 4 n=1 Tax=Adelges cooleyi TaxID=133065 RepID=UPI00217F8306|nr:LYR motif-containing protein 4 [Adelges cooleyi]
MASTSKTAVLKMYKTMLRESSKFSFYNYRMYALRRIKDKFRENKSLRDPTEIQHNMQEANKYLEIIKRQVIVGDLYKSDKLVIEN